MRSPAPAWSLRWPTLCFHDLTNHIARSLLELRRHNVTLAAAVTARSTAPRELAASRRLRDGVLTHTDVVVYAKDLGCTDYDLFPALAADQFRRNDQAIAASGSRQSFA